MGFVENPIASEYGFFQANWAHNRVYLITGAVFLLGVIKYPGQEKRFVLYSGYFYGLVTLLGFVWSGACCWVLSILTSLIAGYI